MHKHNVHKKHRLLVEKCTERDMDVFDCLTRTLGKAIYIVCLFFLITNRTVDAMEPNKPLATLEIQFNPQFKTEQQL